LADRQQALHPKYLETGDLRERTGPWDEGEAVLAWSAVGRET